MLYNNKLIVSEQIKHDDMVQISNKTRSKFKRDYKMDPFTIHMHPRLRNIFGVDKMFNDENNYDCNNTLLNFRSSINEIGQIMVGDVSVYDRYMEDCTTSEDRDIKNNVRKLSCLFTPLQLLTWIEQTRVCDILDLLKEWGTDENTECECINWETKPNDIIELHEEDEDESVQNENAIDSTDSDDSTDDSTDDSEMVSSPVIRLTITPKHHIVWIIIVLVLMVFMAVVHQPIPI
jgi:hypothetical protein